MFQEPHQKLSHQRQVSQLWQRDRAAVLCLHPKSSSCTNVQLPAVVIRQAAALRRTCFKVAKPAFSEGGCITFAEYFTGKGASPTNHCWCQKSRSDCPFVWYQNIHSASFCFVAIHASDGRMDIIAKSIQCIALHAAAR